MKNQPLRQRLRFSLRGIRETFQTEKSFRTQILLGVGAVGVLIFLKPAPHWWALFFLVISGVLAAELFNTALEKALDRLHPEQHSMIGLAKDCAAGAVLVLSLASVFIFCALLWEEASKRGLL